MADVVFKLDAESAKAVRAFLQLDEAQRKVELSSKRATGQTKQHGKAMNDLGRGAIRDLKGIVTGFVSVTAAIGAVRSAWRIWQQDIAASVASMKQFQAEFVNLQFLGQNYRDPNLRGRIHEMAVKYGIPAEEVTAGRYALQSMAGWMPPAERERAVIEAMRMRPTSKVTVPELAPTFAKMRFHYRDLSARQAANMTQRMFELAAIAEPTELANYAPRMFAAGRLGGLSATEAAGFGAFMTMGAGTAAQAASGMDIVMRRLTLQDPEAKAAMERGGWSRAAGSVSRRKAIMARAGISAADSGLTRLYKVADLQRRGGLTKDEMGLLFGEKGLKYGYMAAEHADTLRRVVADFAATTGPDIDIAGEKIGTAVRTDPTYRRSRAAARLAARQAAARQQPDNLLRENFAEALEAVRLEKGGGVGAVVRNWIYRATMHLPESVVGPMGPEMTTMLARQLDDKSGDPTEEARLEAARMLGLAVDKLDKVADKLNAKAEGAKKFNAHVEPESAGAGGGDGY